MVIGKSDLKNIMEKHDLKPSKSLGQNFVVDPNTILKIIRAANIETVSYTHLTLPTTMWV